MLHNLDVVWERLRKMTTSVQEVGDKVVVIFVANRQQTLSDDSLDRATEYFSDYESNQILTGMRDSGFRTLYFDGENEFISFIVNDKKSLDDSKIVLVYNTAQSGTDPGRKSMVPSFCALHGLKTCNSNSYAVSLARHKLHVHAILRKYDIPTPETWAFDADKGWLLNEHPPEGIQLIAKAGHESASIGLDESSVGTYTPSFEKMLREKSASLGQQFVVQRFISGREFELPVINVANSYEPLSPAAITVDGNGELGDRILLYDLIAKDNFGFSTCPKDFASEAFEMRCTAARVCEVLGLNGFARVDFRMDNNRNIWVTDVSTSPHIVMHSSYWHVFKNARWTHSDMLACMIAVNVYNLGLMPTLPLGPDLDV